MDRADKLRAINIAIGRTETTPEQRIKLAEWSKAIQEISDEQLKEEGSAWVESLLSIINETKTKNNNEKK